ncbi:hypothetical protein F5880DRAFT_1635837 [Lentinula raphanica]|nr:hypothetical protein F5880DRAFT_1635837 [Lentinula raphanica]
MVDRAGTLGGVIWGAKRLSEAEECLAPALGLTGLTLLLHSPSFQPRPSLAKPPPFRQTLPLNAALIDKFSPLEDALFGIRDGYLTWPQHPLGQITPTMTKERIRHLPRIVYEHAPSFVLCVGDGLSYSPTTFTQKQLPPSHTRFSLPSKTFVPFPSRLPFARPTRSMIATWYTIRNGDNEFSRALEGRF